MRLDNVDPFARRHAGLVNAWICDVNGVLVDSAALVRQAFVATTARYGIPFGEREFRRVKGLPLLDAYRLLDPAADPGVRRAFHLRYVRERLDDVGACPGALDVLEEARARGVRIGAATSHGEIAETILVKTGLYRFLDCLVTQEEVRRPKPHPDSILRIMQLLGAASPYPEAAHVLCIGDTAADIEAGRAAAVATVGVTYGISPETEIRAARPDYILHSFGEMRQFLGGLAGAWVGSADRASHAPRAGR
jgi:HAD superfamily hydrolase (TIGR01549 family)